MGAAAGVRTTPERPASRTWLLAAVFAGGAMGALIRAASAQAFAAEPTSWPWATLVANLVGALVLGFANERLGSRTSTSRRGAFVAAGFCGAVTTFSTLQWEAVRMAEGGRPLTAAGYVVVSLAAGLVAAAAGVWAARRSRA